MDRRTLLSTAAAGVGGMVLAGCVPRPEPDYPPQSGERISNLSGVGEASEASEPGPAEAPNLYYRKQSMRGLIDALDALARAEPPPGCPAPSHPDTRHPEGFGGARGQRDIDELRELLGGEDHE